MATRKSGLTRRQHIELGERLCRMNAELVTGLVLLANSYPHNAKAVRLARAMRDNLDSLRCELDSVSAKEIPGDAWSPTIYYGANAEVRAQFLAKHPVDESEAGIDRLYG